MFTEFAYKHIKWIIGKDHNHVFNDAKCLNVFVWTPDFSILESLEYIEYKQI